mmetsp:Transcript_19081/g.44883  ORF Transcript_19081/g.44883 Transcript_19081/m.44883 type:complete len:761 (+) Transcript_19081:52-2334(+)|eukprot:CAMPEP_0171098108 /NCGR_PEP_ID=MMETSP0766_2-20121228/47937_1 /TAXON_ID=439317 /ORGANISM="Gambierdiscus australes, Strain CAWD 149" /LENGTH=760 /DNA_ID=CAMNT_0011557411 /DNA_START=51 /DNA_END=2333 /DNA_ORIENTATION=+
MVQDLQLVADAESTPVTKILAAARQAGVEVQLVSGGGRTPCGLPVPELKMLNGGQVRHTNAILRRIAQLAEGSLMGSTFVEAGLVDSWLEWTSLEIDHHLLEGETATEPLCSVLEGHLKSRTFLVGQRLTVADISAACSLKRHLENTGLDELRKTYPNTVRWLLTCVHQLGLNDVQRPVVEAQDTAPTTTSEAAEAAATDETGAAGEVGAEPKASAKREEKRKAKEDAKKAKEEAREEERRRKEEQKEVKFKGPDLTPEDLEQHIFGNLFVQSQRRTGRQWTPVISLTPALKDQSVWVRARVHNSRKQGNKLCFLTLRQDLATVQAVVMGPEAAGFAGALPDESVVDVLGKVVCPEVAVASCTQEHVELSAEKIFCIGRSQPLPLQLADASRSEEECDRDPSLVRVGQETRLDNRVIDLRTVANQAIFRIQSGVCNLFREYLLQQSFQEIHTPKLIGGASEGGADVFQVKYFDGAAFLAQSPQLYKQMALMTDMPRVFEVGPVFRSEKSFTHRHMTEFTGLDIEMTFKDHYHEVLDVIDGLFNHIFDGLNRRFSKEIEAVRKQYPFRDLKWKHPCLRLTFKEAIALLRSKGPAVLEKRLTAETGEYERGIIQKHLDSVKVHKDEEDISTEDEKVLGTIILEEHGEELYIIDKFPKDTRPFYTMPDPVDERWTNAYDVFLRGEEITSGAQRIHDPKMLADKCTAVGVPVSSIQAYIDAFKYGSYPHGGAGIGMERVVMLFLALNNIRKTSMFPRDPKRLIP